MTRVLGRFDLLEEQLGWIIRAKDGIKVKVRRIIAKDEKTEKKLSLTTNDLESFGIHQRKDLRTSCKTLEIEVVFDWLKNTLGYLGYLRT